MKCVTIQAENARHNSWANPYQRWRFEQVISKRLNLRIPNPIPLTAMLLSELSFIAKNFSFLGISSSISFSGHCTDLDLGVSSDWSLFLPHCGCIQHLAASGMTQGSSHSLLLLQACLDLLEHYLEAAAAEHNLPYHI